MSATGKGLAIVVAGALVAALYLGGRAWLELEDARAEGLPNAGVGRAAEADLDEPEALLRGSSSPEPRAPAQEVRVDPAPGEVQTPSASRAVVRVRFVDEAGVPLSDAVFGTAGGGATSAPSGPDGRAELVLGVELFRAALDVLFEFEARCPGYALDRREARAAVGETITLGEWKLVPGGGISGRVLDGEGRGLLGASVARFDEAVAGLEWEVRRESSLEDLWKPGARVSTGFDGSFLLEDVPAGEIRLVAVAEGRSAALSAPVTVRAAGIVEGIEIRMEPAGPETGVAGRVVDPDGVGVAFARILLRSSRRTFEMPADERGRFEQDRLDVRCDVTAFDPEGRYREVTAEGVEPGTRGLVLQLAPGPTLELLVVSPEGVPVERYGVRTLAARDGLELSSLPEVERPGGLAPILVPGRDFSLEVAGNGWMPSRLGPFSSGTPPERLDCTLQAAGGVSGVVEAEGKLLEGAWVALYRSVKWATLHNGYPVRRQTFPLISTRSGPGGEFLLSVAERGSYYVRAEAEGLAPAEIGPLELDPGSHLRERLVLGAGGTLEVTVRSSAGASPVGAIVALSRGDGCGATLRTGEEGTLSFDHLMPGRWWVGLAEREIDPGAELTTETRKKPGEIPWNCEVFEGEVTRIDLWLEEPEQGECRLTGRLTIDGEPAEGWLARLDVGREMSGAPEPFAEPGLFRLSVEEPGEYRLFLTTDASDPSAMLVILDPVRLVEGEAYWSLELEMGALVGTMTPPAQEEEPSLVFHLWERGDLRCLAPIVPDAAGTFRCPQVPAGSGRIVRYDPSRGFDETSPEVLSEIEIAPGGTNSIEIR